MVHFSSSFKISLRRAGLSGADLTDARLVIAILFVNPRSAFEAELAWNRAAFGNVFVEADFLSFALFIRPNRQFSFPVSPGAFRKLDHWYPFQNAEGGSVP